MRVLFANRNHDLWIGGDAVQLDNTRAELKRLGVESEYTHSRFTKAADFDLLHAFNINFRWTWWATREALKAGIPYIVSAIFYPKIIENSKDEMKQIVNESFKTIALSEYEKSEMVELLEVSPDKIMVISNGVNKRIFKPGFEYQKRAVTMGRISPEKGMGQAVVACRELGIPILVIGDPIGEYGEAIKTLATEWRSNLSPREVSQELQGSSIYICSSTSERQSLSVLEAAACGLNIVDSIYNRGKDLLPNSLVVDPADSISLQAAIMTQWERERNRDYVPSWGEVAKEIKGIYELAATR